MEETFDDMCLRLDTISQRDGRTDRQTKKQYQVLHADARDKKCFVTKLLQYLTCAKLIKCQN